MSMPREYKGFKLTRTHEDWMWGTCLYFYEKGGVSIYLIRAGFDSYYVRKAQSGNRIEDLEYKTLETAENTLLALLEKYALKTELT
jgi:hypothetical protein